MDDEYKSVSHNVWTMVDFFGNIEEMKKTINTSFEVLKNHRWTDFNSSIKSLFKVPYQMQDPIIY